MLLAEYKFTRKNAYFDCRFFRQKHLDVCVAFLRHFTTNSCHMSKSGRFMMLNMYVCMNVFKNVLYIFYFARFYIDLYFYILCYIAIHKVDQLRQK